MNDGGNFCGYDLLNLSLGEAGFVSCPNSPAMYCGPEELLGLCRSLLDSESKVRKRTSLAATASERVLDWSAFLVSLNRK